MSKTIAELRKELEAKKQVVGPGTLGLTIDLIITYLKRIEQGETVNTATEEIANWFERHGFRVENVSKTYTQRWNISPYGRK